VRNAQARRERQARLSTIWTMSSANATSSHTQAGQPKESLVVDDREPFDRQRVGRHRVQPVGDLVASHACH
jgi:hypothetical protein